VRRSVGVLAGLIMAVVIGPAPAADAVGAGACTITGTINFAPAGAGSEIGLWDISPAQIACRGQFNTYELMLKQAGFSGKGSYTTLPSGEGGCLRELGTGTVDYWIPTEKQDVHVVEPNAFLLAGAGAFTTPTLKGVFQIPAYDQNCLTSAVTKATFLAEVTLVRVSAADYTT
jgi:hypothetical protein